MKGVAGRQALRLEKNVRRFLDVGQLDRKHLVNDGEPAVRRGEGRTPDRRHTTRRRRDHPGGRIVQPGGIRSAELFEIGQIFEPAGRTLGRPQVVSTKDWGLDVAKRRHDPPRPRVIKIQPCDARHDVDAARG